MINALGKKGTLFLLTVFTVMVSAFCLPTDKMSNVSYTLVSLFVAFCGSNIVATGLTAKHPPKDEEGQELG